MAGELSTILNCQSEDEKWGRIELLQRVALWKLRLNTSWPQIRNTFAHVLRRIENRESNWSSDWDSYERHIYDKIASTKTDKFKKQPITTNDTTWFCKNYQNIEGCTRDSPHPARIGNSYKQVHHICASCWLKDKGEYIRNPARTARTRNCEARQTIETITKTRRWMTDMKQNKKLH